ncbi:SGNH/GDSL hydrolase family protein [Streptomyces sp. NPDC001410]|uniref:SGNH/GDSL hydrolase family protein n=1 Tax=Streptomyces sp. NPDC001410 TaxID=3364574 RepID=UPI0036A574CF
MPFSAFSARFSRDPCGRRRRRSRLIAGAALLATSLVTGSASATAATADSGYGHTHYYLSLGNSLAAGYQPDVGHDVPGVSYADQLYARLKAKDPSLVHVNLACSGETTTTMINGGVCTYNDAASQLDAAVAFLKHHRDRVTLVTLDIGANDVDGCVTDGTIDQTCINQGLATVDHNIPSITHALRAAGGRYPQYIGMTYYDPFLAAWLTGPSGQALARVSVQLTDTFNDILARGMHQNRFRIADVARAFETDQFSPLVNLPPFGELPVNVANICRLTWECTPFHDVHANPQGQAVIATVFQDVLFRDSKVRDFAAAANHTNISAAQSR